jgi:hypothetical protein
MVAVVPPAVMMPIGETEMPERLIGDGARIIIAIIDWRRWRWWHIIRGSVIAYRWGGGESETKTVASIGRGSE